MEIAVRLTSDTSQRFSNERLIVRERIAEDVVVAIPDDRIMMKWIEIIGELFSPEKRKMFSSFEYAAQVASIWSDEYRQLWRALLKDQITTKSAWAALHSSGAVYDAMPLDSSGTKKVFNTWVWGDSEKRLFGLAAIDESGMTAGDVLMLDKSVEKLSPLGNVIISNKFKFDSQSAGISDTQMRRYLSPKISIPVNHSAVFPQSIIVGKQ